MSCYKHLIFFLFIKWSHVQSLDIRRQDSHLLFSLLLFLVLYHFMLYYAMLSCVVWFQITHHTKHCTVFGNKKKLHIDSIWRFFAPVFILNASILFSEYILIYSERLIAFLSFRFSFPLPFCSTLTNAPLAEDEDTAEDASGSHRPRPHGIVIDGLECRLALLGHLLYLLYSTLWLLALHAVPTKCLYEDIRFSFILRGKAGAQGWPRSKV